MELIIKKKYFSEKLLADTYVKNAELQKSTVATTKDQFEATVKPGLDFASRCGNVYTSSLIAALISSLAKFVDLIDRF